MIAPLLAFLTGGPEAMGSFIDAIDAMEDLAREDNLAKQRGIYADCSDGIIWDPAQIKRDEARNTVARVRDLLDRSGPLTDPGFLQFLAAPPEDAKPEINELVSRFTTRWQEGGPEAGLAVIADLRSKADGFAEAFERDARRMAHTRTHPPRAQPQKVPKSKRQRKPGSPGR
jgi:hypothetical protein